MKKVIVLLMFFTTLLFSGCSSKVEKVEGIVFSQTKGGETKYAKGQTVYMFKADNEEADKIFNRLKSIIETPINYSADPALDELWKSIYLLEAAVAIDTLKTINTIKIYRTNTDDKGEFTFNDIPSGDYYIFVQNLWDIIYYKNFEWQTSTTGEVKYDKITISKNMNKIVL